MSSLKWTRSRELVEPDVTTVVILHKSLVKEQEEQKRTDHSLHTISVESDLDKSLFVSALSEVRKRWIN